VELGVASQDVSGTSPVYHGLVVEVNNFACLYLSGSEQDVFISARAPSMAERRSSRTRHALISVPNIVFESAESGGRVVGGVPGAEDSQDEDWALLLRR
jgi:hypothetical protein